MGVRDLINEIKNDSYNRLLEKPSFVNLKHEKLFDEKNIKYNIKNPIIIRLNKGEVIKNEKELELKILSQLHSFFLQLGNGFTLVGSEYKIVHFIATYVGCEDIFAITYKLLI